MRPHVTIYADGSWKHKLRSGGYAIFMICGPYWRVIYEGIRDSSNNRAELMAVITGISQLNTPCDIDLVCDSSYALGAVNKRLKINSNMDLVDSLTRVISNGCHTINTIWVKAHTDRRDTNSLGNRVVDYYAQRASDEHAYSEIAYR